jgi:hypothetical protein
MQTSLWITGAILTALPFVIAFKRKSKNFTLIDLLSFFLSWAIIGWVVAMAWAIWGESDPEEFAKTIRWGYIPSPLPAG